jgi:hypothetical protein
MVILGAEERTQDTLTQAAAAVPVVEDLTVVDLQDLVVLDIPVV